MQKKWSKYRSAISMLNKCFCKNFTNFNFFEDKAANFIKFFSLPWIITIHIKFCLLHSLFLLFFCLYGLYHLSLFLCIHTLCVAVLYDNFTEIQYSLTDIFMYDVLLFIYLVLLFTHFLLHKSTSMYIFLQFSPNIMLHMFVACCFVCLFASWSCYQCVTSSISVSIYTDLIMRLNVDNFTNIFTKI